MQSKCQRFHAHRHLGCHATPRHRKGDQHHRHFPWRQKSLGATVPRVRDPCIQSALRAPRCASMRPPVPRLWVRASVLPDWHAARMPQPLRLRHHRLRTHPPVHRRDPARVRRCQAYPPLANPQRGTQPGVSGRTCATDTLCVSPLLLSTQTHAARLLIPRNYTWLVRPPVQHVPRLWRGERLPQLRSPLGA